MATLREQFEQSKKNCVLAESALADTTAALQARPEYRNQKALKRERNMVLEALWKLFESADIPTERCADFKQFRESWAALIPMTSPLWDEVHGWEVRLEGIEKQIKAHGRTLSPLLDAQFQAKKAKIQCEQKFVQMRDLYFRKRQAQNAEREARQANQPQREREAELTVSGTIHLMNRSNRYGDSHTAKAPRSKTNASEAKPDKKNKSGKGSRKQQARQAIAASTQG